MGCGSSSAIATVRKLSYWRPAVLVPCNVFKEHREQHQFCGSLRRQVFGVLKIFVKVWMVWNWVFIIGKRQKTELQLGADLVALLLAESGHDKESPGECIVTKGEMYKVVGSIH
jgi:hypothetical protein